MELLGKPLTEIELKIIEEEMSVRYITDYPRRTILRLIATLNRNPSVPALLGALKRILDDWDRFGDLNETTVARAKAAVVQVESMPRRKRQ